MACPTRAGTAPYVRFIASTTGEVVSQDDWHEAKRMAGVSGGTKPAPMADAIAAAQNLALAFDREGWTHDSHKQMQAEIQAAYEAGQATPESTVTLVNWLAAAGPTATMKQARENRKAKAKEKRETKQKAKQQAEKEAADIRRAQQSYDSDVMFGRVIDPANIRTADGWETFLKVVAETKEQGDTAKMNVLQGVADKHFYDLYTRDVAEALDYAREVSYPTRRDCDFLLDIAQEARERGDAESERQLTEWAKHLAKVAKYEERITRRLEAEDVRRKQARRKRNARIRAKLKKWFL